MPGPFVWTFPLYVLAAGYELLPDGGFAFNEETWYVAPDCGSEPHLIIFTDADLAERTAPNAPPRAEFAFSPSTTQMLQLLETIGPSFPKILIDPNLDAPFSRSAPTSELVDAIKAYLAGELS